jgi:hypothetical protein
MELVLPPLKVKKVLNPFGNRSTSVLDETTNSRFRKIKELET